MRKNWHGSCATICFVLHGHIDEIRPNTLEKYFFNPNLPGRELLEVIYCDGMAAVPEGGIGPDHLKSLTRLMERIEELAAMGAGDKLPPPILNGGQHHETTQDRTRPQGRRIIAALREAQLRARCGTRRRRKNS